MNNTPIWVGLYLGLDFWEVRALKGKLTDSFWENIKRPTDHNECWLWTGSVDRDNAPRYNSKSARKILKEALTGPLAKDKVIRNGCFSTRCIHPKHWTIGPRETNFG